VIKKAKRDPLPAFGSIQPELATLVDDVPRGSYFYETKYDGYRILAWIDKGRVRLASRNGKEWSDRFPEITLALARISKPAIVDGELAYLDDKGLTNFQGLQSTLSGGGLRNRLVYYIFDLLFFDGQDIRDEPLASRKEILRKLLAPSKLPLRFGDHVDKGDALFQKACELGMEGIVAKRSDSTYLSKRSLDWLKVKCQKRQEMVIVGFTPPKGSRQGLGALLLAVHEADGFRYAGKVGTGFSQASLMSLSKRLAKLIAREATAFGAPRMHDVTWVKPALVCEVKFTEWTREGALRHPTFEGLREDKSPNDVVREKESHVK
jgi:bifunctional non-homologous end joining protein LigD